MYKRQKSGSTNPVTSSSNSLPSGETSVASGSTTTAEISSTLSRNGFTILTADVNASDSSTIGDAKAESSADGLPLPLLIGIIAAAVVCCIVVALIGGALLMKRRRNAHAGDTAATDDDPVTYLSGDTMHAASSQSTEYQSVRPFADSARSSVVSSPDAIYSRIDVPVSDQADEYAVGNISSFEAQHRASTEYSALPL